MRRTAGRACSADERQRNAACSREYGCSVVSAIAPGVCGRVLQHVVLRVRLAIATPEFERNRDEGRREEADRARSFASLSVGSTMIVPAATGTTRRRVEA